MTEIWLIEEHSLNLDSGEIISGHWMVPRQLQPEVPFLERARGAFTTAEKIARQDLVRMSRWALGENDSAFLFAAEELDEVSPGYLAQAADGSTVAYEVRYAGCILE